LYLKESSVQFYFILFFSLVMQAGYTQPVQFSSNNFPGIKGNLTDSSTRKPLAGRIVITNDTGKVINSFYEKLPGFFTQQDGSFEQPLPPGHYMLTAFHGIDYLSKTYSFNISSQNGIQADISLQRWIPLKEMGWVNGEGHDHLYTDVKQDSAMLDTVRRICIAQGIDFMCAAQGWAGYNDTNWQNGYAKFSDDRFHIVYGSEMPKYRTGHTWWMGQKTTRNYFSATMDTTYENQYYQSDKGTTWTFQTLPFPNIPDFEVVQRFKDAEDAVAVMAHPTSWWWQKRGNIEKYVTNAACYLPFGLLSGKIWDGQVVMGYDHDHYYYQNLWFHVLNEGYRMTPLSELDGGYNRGDKFYYGSMRTYYKIDGDFSIDKITAAVRKGRTFVTSGPIVMADVDGKYQYGDIVPANNKNHLLHIKAYASGEENDFLSYIVVFRNGRVFKLWDVRNNRQRTFAATLPFIETNKGWYVIKVYGVHAWKDTASLDVMSMVNGKNVEKVEGELDVAITSPFYIWPTAIKDPKAMESKIQLTLTPAIANAKAEILLKGKRIQTIALHGGKANFVMPVNAYVKITARGHSPVYRSLYLDYAPHLQLLEELSSGKWMNKFDSTQIYHPGEIPWDEFHYSQAKKILSDVDWNIDMKPNNRDAQWEQFESLFR
jgi:hypothetical protein